MAIIPIAIDCLIAEKVQGYNIIPKYSIRLNHGTVEYLYIITTTGMIDIDAAINKKYSYDK